MPLSSSHHVLHETHDHSGSGLDPAEDFDFSAASSRVAKYGVFGAVLDLLEPVIMRTTPLIFATAIERKHLERFWVWLERMAHPKQLGNSKRVPSRTQKT